MRKELRVDVSAAAGTGEQLTVAATILLPDGLADRPGEPRTVIVGFPGGGYNRRYYDLDIPGHDGYSQARYHLARGQVFVTCDHLGVGDSDIPGRPLDYDAVARADMAGLRTSRWRTCSACAAATGGTIRCARGSTATTCPTTSCWPT